MFNNGITPILGPIKEEDLGGIIKDLKKEPENKETSFLIIDGTIC